MSRGQPGRCIFCEQHYIRLSKEDAMPKWLVRNLRDNGYGPPRERRVQCVVSYPDKPPLKYKFNALTSSGHMHTYTVCESCNNGWMSQLENHFKATFVALTTRPSPNVPSPSTNELMCRWAFKTAITVTAQHAEHTGEHIYATSSRRAIMDGTIPPNTDIRLLLPARPGMGANFRAFATRRARDGTFRYASVVFLRAGPWLFAIRHAQHREAAMRLITLTRPLNTWIPLTPRQLVTNWSERVDLPDQEPDLDAILDGIPDDQVNEDSWIELQWDPIGIPPDERP